MRNGDGRVGEMTRQGRWAALLLLGASVGACGSGGETDEQAQADAAAANFTPPSVTSRVDFGSAMERRFRALDRNADEVIDAEEMPSQDSRIVRLDRNRDGEVTATEFSEGSLALFDRMDLNRDGTVTSEERTTFRSRPAASPTPSNSAPQLP